MQGLTHLSVVTEGLAAIQATKPVSSGPAVMLVWERLHLGQHRDIQHCLQIEKQHVNSRMTNSSTSVIFLERMCATINLLERGQDAAVATKSCDESGESAVAKGIASKTAE